MSLLCISSWFTHNRKKMLTGLTGSNTVWPSVTPLSSSPNYYLNHFIHHLTKTTTSLFFLLGLVIHCTLWACSSFFVQWVSLITIFRMISNYFTSKHKIIPIQPPLNCPTHHLLLVNGYGFKQFYFWWIICTSSCHQVQPREILYLR